MKPSGVELVDHVLGGLAEGLPLVVEGRSGTGRTVFVLQLLAAACARGEKCVLLTGEPPSLVLRQAASLDLSLDEAVGDGRLVILELDARVATAIRIHGGDAFVEAIKDEIGCPDMLVLESISSLTQEVLDNALLRGLLTQLFAIPDAEKGVSVVTVNSAHLKDGSALNRGLQDLCGCLIRLSRTPDGQRLLTVDKARTGTPVAGAVPVSIESGGFQRVEGEVIDRRSSDRRSKGGRRDDDRLPADGADAAAVARRDPDARPRVLQVEDSVIDQERMLEILGDEYELSLASDGFEAITMILSEKPDVILLDLVLPRVDGYEVLRALSSSGNTIPVLVVSSHLARAADRVRALILGASDVLQKPANPMELKHKITTLLALPLRSSTKSEAHSASELLEGGEDKCILSARDFLDLLTRAVWFGLQYSIPSTLVAVDCGSSDAMDELVAVADDTLRTDDAIHVVDEERVLFMLVLSSPEEGQAVIPRLSRALQKAGVSFSDFRYGFVGSEPAAKALGATPGEVIEPGLAEAVSADPTRWKNLFDFLEPWPDSSDGG